MATTVAIAVAIAAAGCTGEAPGAARFARPPGLPPAEQRLQFEWAEDVTVPADARAAVGAARDWLYAFFLWNTEPSTIPPHLTRHTGEALMREIEIAGNGAPWLTGPVRIILVEVDIAGDTITLGTCEDKRSQHKIDAEGDPIPENRTVIGLRQLRMARSGTGWIAENRSYSPELRDRCAEIRASPPPTPTEVTPPSSR